MFGEDESESPRAASPWDSLLSTSPPAGVGELQRRFANVIPKLVPEVEEGNVEYKLKLINPTGERFSRLVTQMKWRLLEGGGQAYYELGVADSGQLVGLSRLHMEQSLQTLEEMAGEIGASVIVVKEIELPRSFMDMDHLRKQRSLDGAMRMPRMTVEVGFESATEAEADSMTETTEATETEFSTPETDDELDVLEPFVGRNLIAAQGALERLALGDLDDDRPMIKSPQAFLRSHPDRPTAQSSPAILPIDSGAEADSESDPVPIFELQVASVHKLRPHRKRDSASTHGERDNGGQGRSRNSARAPAVKVTVTTPVSEESTATSTKLNKPHTKNADAKAKAEYKRLAQQRKAANKAAKKQRQVQAHSAAANETVILSYAPLEGPPRVDVEAKEMPIKPDQRFFEANNADDESAGEDRDRRLIVECLVVRKMSMEEAYLDFGGFSFSI